MHLVGYFPLEFECSLALTDYFSLFLCRTLLLLPLDYSLPPGASQRSVFRLCTQCWVSTTPLSLIPQYLLTGYRFTRLLLAKMFCIVIIIISSVLGTICIAKKDVWLVSSSYRLKHLYLRNSIPMRVHFRHITAYSYRG